MHTHRFTLYRLRIPLHRVIHKLQHTTTQNITLQPNTAHRNTTNQTATHVNKLQHTCIHCNTIKNCSTLQHFCGVKFKTLYTSHCSTLQPTVNDCSRLQQTPLYSSKHNVLQHVSCIRENHGCNLLQHTVITLLLQHTQHTVITL